MSLQLTDEQRSLVATVREFAARECASPEQRRALTADGTTTSNYDIAKKLAELGFLGLSLPEEYGGSGGSLFEACLFVEELAYGRIPLASYPVTLIVAHSYVKFATAELARELVGKVTAGAATAIAMSEPGSGSDVAALTCKAEKVDGGYRINGQKTWISNAHSAEEILLVARSADTGDKHQGITMLSVPTAIPGVEIRPIATLGAEVNDVYFTDAFVGADRLVGAEGQGWAQLISGLNIERVVIGALALGQARRAFDDTLRYVKERSQFGRPIGSFQALSQRLADLATEIEATRVLVHDVAQRVDENPGVLLPREASMVKLKATELAKHAALEGVQMLGGMGYTEEAGMAEMLRMTVVGTIVGGTSEIQRDIIAKTLGL
ncbi:acyl-CoA dehydrogenase family protein [Skermania piniformis]|uniref:Acyl-CoA/acyl-ACP dehydrogenase n=1 Tax=Skermania pinensis TaxID=39122 RepID=A0ABX8S7Z4_9ACTN|nr:acyl-CoA dehydrogenase family protein [Skermania piniformis]QXQ12680.1 acyl-CoA/acyl-ACP dehydrogenase [Skermania piniformis]